MALGTQGDACDLGAAAAQLIYSTWDSQAHRRRNRSEMGDRERGGQSTEILLASFPDPRPGFRSKESDGKLGGAWEQGFHSLTVQEIVGGAYGKANSTSCKARYGCTSIY